MLETLLSEEDTLILAARIGIYDETAVPPVGAEIVEEVMDNAIAEGCCDDLANDGIVDDEGNAATGAIMMMNHALTERDDILHVVEFETVLVDGITLAFAGSFVSTPKFNGEEFAKAMDAHLLLF